jgi:hypothetical protein
MWTLPGWRSSSLEPRGWQSQVAFQITVRHILKRRALMRLPANSCCQKAQVVILDDFTTPIG